MPFNIIVLPNTNATEESRMIMQASFPLADTGYRYALHLDPPIHARGNTYCVFATLTALIPARDREEHVPFLSASGKHDFDAQANLEGVMELGGP